jgi:hypothetical protein
MGCRGLGGAKVTKVTVIPLVFPGTGRVSQDLQCDFFETGRIGSFKHLFDIF